MQPYCTSYVPEGLWDLHLQTILPLVPLYNVVILIRLKLQNCPSPQQQGSIHMCVYRKYHIGSFILSHHPTDLEIMMMQWDHSCVKLIHCCSLAFVNSRPLKYKLVLSVLLCFCYFFSIFFLPLGHGNKWKENMVLKSSQISLS